jgi:hypothetical protein
MIALDRKEIHAVYAEMKKMGISFVVILAALQIAFYKESILNTARMLLAFYWLFVLPGMAVMLHFRETFEFYARLVIGTATGLGTYGAISYGLGIAGLGVKYHWAIIPTAIIAVSVILLLARKGNGGKGEKRKRKRE